MTDATQELRIRAEILHGRIQSGDERAIARLRSLPQHARATDHALAEIAPGVRRADCLAILARELGFPNWTDVKRILSGEGPGEDFGDLLWDKRLACHFNVWLKTYDEAAAVREQTGRYLLAYKRHFVLVDRYYIEHLGLDPDDPDWAAIGFDWVRPKDNAARARLYAKLVVSLPKEAA